jgi:hypothetical protein
MLWWPSWVVKRCVPGVLLNCHFVNRQSKVTRVKNESSGTSSMPPSADFGSRSISLPRSRASLQAPFCHKHEDTETIACSRRCCLHWLQTQGNLSPALSALLFGPLINNSSHTKSIKDIPKAQVAKGNKKKMTHTLMSSIELADNLVGLRPTRGQC